MRLVWSMLLAAVSMLVACESGPVEPPLRWYDDGVDEACIEVPDRVSFGAVPVGAASDVVPVSIVSTCAGTLELRRIDADGQDAAAFVLVDLDDVLLREGEEAELRVQFMPEILGHLTGRLVFESNAADGAAVMRVDGLGVGW